MGPLPMGGPPIIWWGAGAPTPLTGPAKPTGAAPKGGTEGTPRPAGAPRPGPPNAASGRLGCCWGGASAIKVHIFSPVQGTEKNIQYISLFIYFYNYV